MRPLSNKTKLIKKLMMLRELVKETVEGWKAHLLHSAIDDIQNDIQGGKWEKL